MSAPIGMIGLGLVGCALSKRLLDKGFQAVGYDIRESARTEFVALGGIALDSAHAVAQRTAVLVLAMFDTADVLSILEGPSSVLRDTQVTLVIDCSTGNAQALAALAARLQAQGIAFLEAPMSGSSSQIANGAATMLLGGEDSVVAAQQALLEALSPKRVHVGSAGMGARAKLATNLVLGLNRAALAEGMAFAEQLGLAPQQFLDLVLASPARSEAATLKGPMMVAGDFAPQSRIRQHLKDVDLMLAQSPALPLTQAHAALLRAAVAAGDGELDNAAIIQQLRRALNPIRAEAQARAEAPHPVLH